MSGGLPETSKPSRKSGPDIAGTINDQGISLSYTEPAVVNRPHISGTISLRLKY